MGPQDVVQFGGSFARVHTEPGLPGESHCGHPRTPSMSWTRGLAPLAGHLLKVAVPGWSIPESPAWPQDTMVQREQCCEKCCQCCLPDPVPVPSLPCWGSLAEWGFVGAQPGHTSWTLDPQVVSRDPAWTRQWTCLPCTARALGLCLDGGGPRRTKEELGPRLSPHRGRVLGIHGA